MALLSVRRACGFAVIAICTTMSGLLFDPLLAARTGATLTTVMFLILLYKAREAPRRDHRKTELWILLDRRPELPDAVAGRVINTVLRDVYMQHAGYTALAALVMWATTVVGPLFA